MLMKKITILALCAAAIFSIFATETKETKETEKTESVLVDTPVNDVLVQLEQKIEKEKEATSDSGVVIRVEGNDPDYPKALFKRVEAQNERLRQMHKEVKVLR